MNTFSKNLKRELYRVKVFGQKDAAKLLGVSQGIVSMYFSGKIVPPMKQIAKFCKILKIPVERLIESEIHTEKIETSSSSNENLVIEIPNKYKILGVEIAGNKVKISFSSR